ncbi:MAG: hypothetical protein II951_11005 [Bacteroidales bacterium]|nr:hypothetical protein [Bacteroidales bacterium]
MFHKIGGRGEDVERGEEEKRRRGEGGEKKRREDNKRKRNRLFLYNKHKENSITRN